MSQMWSSIHEYGAQHGVDPLLFAAIYVARLPLLLISLAALAKRTRRRRGVAPAAVVFLSLGVMPYVYVLAFGRGLPLWFEAAVVVVALLAMVQGLRKLRGTLQHSPIGNEATPTAEDV